MNKKILRIAGDVIGLFLCFVIFIIPFIFMFVNAFKERKEASNLSISLPSEWVWQNFVDVLQNSNYQILTAFKNSFIMTAGAVIVLVIFCSMGGYYIQRRRDKTSERINMLIMAGLMIPPAILPTIWVMQYVGVYKTMFGIIIVEVALNIPFTIMLYRGYMGSIPVEMEEAAIIDGCGRARLFKDIIFPLLKPITSTVIILNAVTIFNDYTNPLYFFTGTDNITVQIVLYSYIGQFSSSYNLLFAAVLFATVPMLIIFLIFNKKIVDGMVAGSVKG